MSVVGGGGNGPACAHEDQGFGSGKLVLSAVGILRMLPRNTEPGTASLRVDVGTISEIRLGSEHLLVFQESAGKIQHVLTLPIGAGRLGALAQAFAGVELCLAWAHARIVNGAGCVGVLIAISPLGMASDLVPFLVAAASDAKAQSVDFSVAKWWEEGTTRHG